MVVVFVVVVVVAAGMFSLSEGSICYAAIWCGLKVRLSR
jgi:hypothetical protein